MHHGGAGLIRTDSTLNVKKVNASMLVEISYQISLCINHIARIYDSYCDHLFWQSSVTFHMMGGSDGYQYCSLTMTYGCTAVVQYLKE